MQLVNLNIDNIENIKETYNLEYLQLFKLEDVYPLLVYVVKSNNFEDTWEQINFTLTQYIENYLDNFNKWNMYLLFITEENITKEVQYKIENDTLAFRKITESNYSNELTEENIKELISKHVLFTDLNIENTYTNISNYNSETNIWTKIVAVNELNDENLEFILDTLEGEINEI
jgi:hypothetical protein